MNSALKSRLGLQELGLQISREREIEHHVDRMPAFFRADLAERLADVLLQLRLVFDPLHNQLAQTSADAGRILVQLRASRVSLLIASRIAGSCILAIFSSLRAGESVSPPGGRHIVEIPVLQREGETAAHRSALAENRQAFGARVMQPVEALAMDLRILRDSRVIAWKQDRPLGLSGKRLDKCQIVLDMAGRLRDLDEAFVALAQHPREIEDVLIAHRVGHHRRAVEVGLRRIAA